MPKLLHEALVQLVRAAPGVIVDLVRKELGELPLASTLEVLPQISAAELVNLDLPELRADAVIVLRDPHGRPVLAIVIEAQGEVVARKRRVWPFYVTGLGVRFDCPAVLVVLALDAKVAAWCGETIDFGAGRGVLVPVVIGTKDVPVVVEAEVALAHPELAVLSVLAHGHEPGAEFIARAALAGCERLDTQAGIHYRDFIAAFLGDIARAALGQIMQTEDQNPFFSREYRQWYDDSRAAGLADGLAEGLAKGVAEGLAKGVAEGLAKGVAEGLAKGVAKGVAEGVAKGVARGKAQSLLKMFRLRGWTASAELEMRVLACEDEAQIDLWADRVLEMKSLDEVFTER